MENSEKVMSTIIGYILANNDKERTAFRNALRDKTGSLGNIARTPREVCESILLELGAPCHLLGYEYTVEAILLVAKDKYYINNVTFALYPSLAEKFGTTKSRVERSIRNMIEVAFGRGDWKVFERYFGNSISTDKGKPTNSEFIARLAQIVNSKTGN